MSHGSPGQMEPGVVVRIRCSGVVYSSKRLRKPEALDVASVVRQRVRDHGGLDSLCLLPEFPSLDLIELAINAGRLIAVEVRCVNGDGALVSTEAADGDGGTP